MRIYLLVAVGLVALAGIAYSQTATNPSPSAMVCAYNPSAPVPTSGSFILVQCDSTGKLGTK